MIESSARVVEAGSVPNDPVLLRDISDTARWAAVFRARETARPDALFRDPFAAKLAGTRGLQIADALSNEAQAASWVMRTYLFDQFLARELERGTDMVVNLAAGLDARPYRTTFPSKCQWVEVDLPEILAHKRAVLANDKPNCDVRLVPLDLRDAMARRAFFAECGRRATRILILTEGLLMYLEPGEVAALSQELAAEPHMQRWLLEVVSPHVLKTMEQQAGAQLAAARAQLKFGPAEGPQFFAPYGWETIEVRSVVKAAIRFNRTPFDPQVHELLPESSPEAAASTSSWVGVCLLQRTR